MKKNPGLKFKGFFLNLILLVFLENDYVSIPQNYTVYFTTIKGFDWFFMNHMYDHAIFFKRFMFSMLFWHSLVRYVTFDLLFIHQISLVIYLFWHCPESFHFLWPWILHYSIKTVLGNPFDEILGNSHSL
mgnify:CR=1 FL=1